MESAHSGQDKDSVSTGAGISQHLYSMAVGPYFLLHLCKRRLRLGPPKGHVHGTVELDRPTETRGLATPGQSSRTGCRGHGGSGPRAAHAQFLGQGEGLR